MISEFIVIFWNKTFVYFRNSVYLHRVKKLTAAKYTKRPFD